MKKLLGIVFVLLLIAGGALWAQESFIVQSVFGRISKDFGNKREEVKVGETLTGNTVLRTGINSSITLKSGEKTYTIGAVQNGEISMLVTENPGIRLENRVARTNQAAGGRVRTAFARASIAVEEEDIAAE
jgi:hypothetical protein